MENTEPFIGYFCAVGGWEVRKVQEKGYGPLADILFSEIGSKWEAESLARGAGLSYGLPYRGQLDVSGLREWVPSHPIHAISATVTDRGHLFLCGEVAGEYDEAKKTHPVGNYTMIDSPTGDRVTCFRCRERMTEG